jgi:hypothetical protein
LTARIYKIIFNDQRCPSKARGTKEFKDSVVDMMMMMMMLKTK